MKQKKKKETDTHRYRRSRLSTSKWKEKKKKKIRVVENPRSRNQSSFERLILSNSNIRRPPLLSFKCSNDSSRIVSPSKSVQWINLIAPIVTPKFECSSTDRLRGFVEQAEIIRRNHKPLNRIQNEFYSITRRILFPNIIRMDVELASYYNKTRARGDHARYVNNKTYSCPLIRQYSTICLLRDSYSR